MVLSKKRGPILSPTKKKLTKNSSFNGTAKIKPEKQRRKSVAAFRETKVEKDVKPLEPPTVNKFKELEDKYRIKYNQIKTAIEGTIKFTENNPKLKNTLFSENFPLFLQVNSVKVPDCHPHIIRLLLEHSYVDPDSEICLIVPDLKKIRNREYEKHYEVYEDILKKHGIDNIKKIMTFHELKWEFETYEQLRRLVDLYDIFLVDGRVSGRVVRKCGSIFYRKRKVPTPVKLYFPNLKNHFEMTLKKTSLYIRGKTDSFSVQFGTNKMQVDHLVENIFKLLEGLDKQFPGGYNNIRSLVVFAHRGLKIPIYQTLKKPNDVVIEKREWKKPKTYETVVGELSTRLNSEVVVEPDGTVTVRQIRRKKEDDSADLSGEENEVKEEEEDSEIGSSDDEEDEDEFEENQVKKTKGKPFSLLLKKMTQDVKGEEEEDSEMESSDVEGDEDEEDSEVGSSDDEEDEGDSAVGSSDDEEDEDEEDLEMGSSEDEEEDEDEDEFEENQVNKTKGEPFSLLLKKMRQVVEEEKESEMESSEEEEEQESKIEEKTIKQTKRKSPKKSLKKKVSVPDLKLKDMKQKKALLQKKKSTEDTMELKKRKSTVEIKGKLKKMQKVGK